MAGQMVRRPKPHANEVTKMDARNELLQRAMRQLDHAILNLQKANEYGWTPFTSAAWRTTICVSAMIDDHAFSITYPKATYAVALRRAAEDLATDAEKAEKEGRQAIQVENHLAGC